jgi:hypothetical protein
MLYKLKQINSPEFNGNHNVGGIKLTYDVDGETQVFLKPFKSVSGERKDFKKGQWGNTMSPFIALWYKVNRDYTNFKEEFIELRYSEITNESLISNLNKRTKKFEINTGESKTSKQLTTSMKIRLNIALFMDKIFINQK